MRSAIIAAGFCLSMIGSCFAQTSTAAMTRVETHIPPQALESALKQVAKLDHIRVLYLDAAVDNVRTPGASGYLTVDDTLRHLLSGTDLQYRYVNTNAVSIFANPAAQSSKRSATATNDTRDPPHAPKVNIVAQPATSTDPATEVDPPKRKAVTRPPSPLHEVVVTGTLIPGVKNLASPLTVFTGADIRDSGVSSIQEFMQAQSFDFGGGASQETIGSINGGASANNNTNGSGFNLRGVGNNATLVLLDGVRIAPGNTIANFVDTSLIPLNSIARIEVEPAGASATYGADAVGGVVNLITIRNFQGLETHARYGFAADSGNKEVQFGQLGGKSWESGSAVFAYEFDDFTPLLAQDRSYLYPPGTGPTQYDLMDEQVRQSAFLSIQQTVTDAISVYATGIYSHRESDEFDEYGTRAVPAFDEIVGPVHTSLAEAIVGTDITVTPQDVINVTAAYSGTRSNVDVSYNGSTSFLTLGAPSTVWSDTYSILSLTGKLTGLLLDLPSGPLHFAIGGEARREAYAFESLNAAEFEPTRTIQSGFLELNIPILRGNSGPLLSADLAARVDRYSDFGTTTNPNVGIVWRPVEVLKLRTTFGTSYVAPDLADLNSIPQETFTLAEPNPATGGLSNVLGTFGGNPRLKPETADAFTVGADFGRDSTKGFSGGVTYYHIKFQHEISNIGQLGFGVGKALEDESELGPSVVESDPPLSELTYLTSQPTYFSLVPGGAPLNSIVAIVNDTYLNLSRLTTDGIDLHASYTRGLSYGILAAGVDGTYILNYESQITAELPLLSLLNTPYNPIDLKARAKVSFTHDAWFLAGFLNYVNSYEDNRVPPTAPVSSWTTLDLNLRYKIPDGVEFLKGASLSLSVLNATNRHPPYVAAPPGDDVPAADFDGANANVLGRVISFDIKLRY
jgi:iron complex outermembrane recepter protein